MKLRRYEFEDCNEIAKLFHDTVHSINSRDYTESQLNAWAVKDIDLIKWNRKLSANYSIVVEKNNIIVGFGDVDSTGYFDHLFTHKDYQGMGVATLIANKIEKHCLQNGNQVITTDASISAKTFFEKRRYIVQTSQSVEIRGQLLDNFRTEKYFAKSIDIIKM